MSPAQVQELRQVVRREEAQTHVRDVLWQRPPKPLAGKALARRRDAMPTRHEFYRQAWGWAEPLPSPWQVVRGIPHKNLHHPVPLLQEPVQAIASRKQHYLKKLETILDEAAAPGAPELPFTRLLPNLQFLYGPVCVLDDEARWWYSENFGHRLPREVPQAPLT